MIVRSLFFHKRCTFGGNALKLHIVYEVFILALELKGETHMFCKDCGSKLLENSTFCSNCGAKIQNDHENMKRDKYVIQKPPQAPTPPVSPQPSSPTIRQNPPVTTETTKPKKKTSWIWIVAVIALLALFFGDFGDSSSQHALVGTWSNNRVTVEFSSNGTYTFSGPYTERGTWNTSGSNGVVLSSGGISLTGVFEINGRELTLSIGGTRYVLTRQ